MGGLILIEQQAAKYLLDAAICDLLRLSRYQSPSLLTRSIARLENLRDGYFLPLADGSEAEEQTAHGPFAEPVRAACEENRLRA